MAVRAPRIAALLLLTATAFGGNYLRADAGRAGPDIRFDDVTLGDLAYTDEPLGADFLDLLRADATLFRTYHDINSDPPVWVFLGYFSRQREGSQVHAPQHCYPGSGWAIVADMGSRGPVPGAGSLVVNDGQQSRFVAYWYQFGDATTSNVFDLKLRLTKNAIARRPQAVVFARVSTVIDNDVSDAAARIEPVVAQLREQIARKYESHDEPR